MEKYKSTCLTRLGKWLTLIGPSGVGKTMAITAWYQNWWLTIGRQFTTHYGTLGLCTSRFLQWPSMVARWRAGDFRADETLASDDLIVLDDISFRAEPTPFLAEKLTDLLILRERKATLMTTNHSLAWFAKNIDQRIADRMLRNGNVVFNLNTKPWSQR